MMRQAGRYMSIYKELCKKHPTFRRAPGEAKLACCSPTSHVHVVELTPARRRRERSETKELVFEISMQPYRCASTRALPARDATCGLATH